MLKKNFLCLTKFGGAQKFVHIFCTFWGTTTERN